MDIKKFLTTLSFAGATGLIVFEIFSSLYRKPLLYLVVRSQGFKTLLEIKKEPFNKWKRIFVTNRADLFRENFIPYLTNKASDAEGAYYLNRWCREAFNSTDWDSLTLWRTRRYCTATWAIEFLEEDGVHLVEELDEELREKEWNKVFKELRGNIARAGVINEFNERENNADRAIALLQDWCGYRLNQHSTKENYLDKKYARSWCVTLDSPRRNEA
ncbi:hypothetical protein A6V39_04670 [Candidatus Mycoplasma haematobovis]|uniref:Uncharacterized protein n=1 Tax=Candidatus Mycoplasma haematobovis TaxID=432608 RepID=A0A1A9QCM7_9MOLU|nr:hypothetical protein [Candidatus Mycoplasma haematobovis]OAL09844.1 hypothetical protein A6V39_04670 [Candidatus Mycoplasma haematobovis]